MGVIGESLLKRIEEAETIGDWNLLMRLLDTAQKTAVRNYTEMTIKMVLDSHDKNA